MENIAGLAFAYALTLAPSSIPLGLVLWGLMRLARRFAPRYRVPTVAIGAGVLFMPVWGPATIAVVPVPLGLILLLTAVTLDFDGLPDLLGLAPVWWYPCGFAATALAAYACARLLSNKSSKPTPLRGAA